jgi:hypothetical protein
MVVGDQKLVEETATIDARLEKNGYREWGTSRLKGNWVTVFAKSKR